jgi:hypothetical protein
MAIFDSVNCSIYVNHYWVKFCCYNRVDMTENSTELEKMIEQVIHGNINDIVDHLEKRTELVNCQKKVIHL